MYFNLTQLHLQDVFIKLLQKHYKYFVLLNCREKQVHVLKKRLLLIFLIVIVLLVY